MSDSGPIIIKRKKAAPAHHHGGSWKVAYADFVTAMMAFFMVMWIMGMDAETRSMVQGYFNDPLGFIKNPPKTQTAFPLPGSPAPKPGKSRRHGSDILDHQNGEAKELQRVQEDLERAIESDASLKELLKHVEVTMTEEGLRIELVEAAGAVFFESGKAVILPAARRLIGRIGPVLARAERKVIIEGHTDAAPYPGQRYTNWDLSTDRASSLRRALSESKVPYRLFAEVRGYADTRLKKPDQPTHYSNRRVTILLPFRTDSLASGKPSDPLKERIQSMFKSAVDIAPP